MHFNLNEVDIGKLWSVSNLLLQLKTVKNIQELRDYHDFFSIFMLREIGFLYRFRKPSFKDSSPYNS